MGDAGCPPKPRPLPRTLRRAPRSIVLARLRQPNSEHQIGAGARVGQFRRGTMTANNVLHGGQVIVDYLIREKVPYVFGLCGHGNISFIDALYERSSDIKTISVHHES